ncbi:hypothetical protein Apa02nite_003180 [Actinoplanes palleronii]|uniref:Uncharacterized protein n=1 Tax=Actinoplanes palleronii TaxID=113570 RepID=A0ABQ4B1S8_9ACTN|nr:hypothetical protein Apa02nite_003180 [Actinoplanes palleronii]
MTAAPRGSGRCDMIEICHCMIGFPFPDQCFPFAPTASVVMTTLGPLPKTDNAFIRAILEPTTRRAGPDAAQPILISVGPCGRGMASDVFGCGWAGAAGVRARR